MESEEWMGQVTANLAARFIAWNVSHWQAPARAKLAVVWHGSTVGFQGLPTWARVIFTGWFGCYLASGLMEIVGPGSLFALELVTVVGPLLLGGLFAVVGARWLCSKAGGLLKELRRGRK